MATIRALLSEVDLSVGEVVYPPGGRLGPRHQRDVELILIHAGHADVAIDGEPPRRIRAGCAGLLLPGHIERFGLRRRGTHAPLVGAGARSDIDRFARLPPVLPASAALSEVMRAAVTAARVSLPTSTQVTAALASAAVWRYIGEAEYHEAGPSTPVERARGFIHHRLPDADVDLRAIAAVADVTPAHPVRRFRAELGTTPVAYLWQQSVATGIELLTSTGLPVSEIASRRVKPHRRGADSAPALALA